MSCSLANLGTNLPLLQCMEKGLKTLQNMSRNAARREKAVRDHRADSDDGSCHLDEPRHHHHRHHHDSNRNRNGSDLGREEVMHPYRGDDVPPLPPNDMSISATLPSYNHSNRNSSSLSREEAMHSYRGDDVPPLPPADMSVSSARSPHTPHRTFSTAATTPTSYAPITVVSQGPSHVLPPMQSPHDSSPHLPSIKSIWHPTPVTTH